MSLILLPVGLVLVIGVISGVALTVAAKIMYIPVDEKIAMLRESLPGANCGACGFAGCDDYAAYAAAASGDAAALALCPVGGSSVAAALGEIMGLSVDSMEKQFAEVRCMGSCNHTSALMDYKGVQSCKAAKQFFGGSGSCADGCMGFGDCVNACAFNAIGIVNGVAWVDRDNCTGCGQCVKACPSKIISMAPARNLVWVGCSSTDKGSDTGKVCTIGCIACKKCEKVCKFDAIKVENNHATIDPEKCTNCGMCVKECPKDVIIKLPKPPKKAAV